MLFYLGRFDLQTGPERCPEGPACTGATGCCRLASLVLEEAWQVMEHRSWTFPPLLLLLLLNTVIFEARAGGGFTRHRPSSRPQTEQLRHGSFLFSLFSMDTLNESLDLKIHNFGGGRQRKGINRLHSSIFRPLLQIQL